MEELMKMYLSQKKDNIVDVGALMSHLEAMSPQELANMLVFLMALLLMISKMGSYTSDNKLKVAAVVGQALYEGVENSCKDYMGMSIQQTLLKMSLYPEVDEADLDDQEFNNIYSTNIVHC
jgi:hypothetical protein